MAENLKCQFAYPGTYGHECGSPATHLMVTIMSEDTKTALRCMGTTPSPDGLSRSGRCELHRGMREFGSGELVRTEGEICRKS